MSEPQLTLLRAGLTTVQDLGRAAGARHGFPAGGALDQCAARTANVLAGNPQGAPLLEITATGLTCTPSVDTIVAVAGAADLLTVDGLPCPVREPVSVRAGSRIVVAEPRAGLRSYLAVHGGMVAPTLLGSVAPDPVLGFGPRLTDGAALGLLREFPAVDHPHLRHPAFRVGYGSTHGPRPGPAVVEVTDGPDIAEFGDTAERLFEGPFVVGPQSDAIGLRMSGILPRRVARGELLSRGMPVGAVEVPAGDELVVLHRGRGVTAGYPVLAVVTATGLDLLGQVRPGDTVRFRPTMVTAALAERRHRQAGIDALATRVRAAFAAIGRPLPEPPAAVRRPAA
jgi:5-oxoprolinase (ATP-hydrolysing) subunit C